MACLAFLVALSACQSDPQSPRMYMLQASALVNGSIQIGTDRANVLQKLGTPHRVEKYGTTEFFFYNPPLPMQISIWATDRLPIAIKDGKVVGFGNRYYHSFVKIGPVSQNTYQAARLGNTRAGHRHLDAQLAADYLDLIRKNTQLDRREALLRAPSAVGLHQSFDFRSLAFSGEDMISYKACDATLALVPFVVTEMSPAFLPMISRVPR